MPRLFIAIDLPEDVKVELTAIGYGLPGARWVTDDQLHLTLRFIGEVDGGMRNNISDALSFINYGSFTFTLQGAGHFPPRGKPKVLWIGIAKSQPLLQLRGKVESALRAIGLSPEGRKFSPHITLARLKNDGANIYRRL